MGNRFGASRCTVFLLTKPHQASSLVTSSPLVAFPTPPSLTPRRWSFRLVSCMFPDLCALPWPARGKQSSKPERHECIANTPSQKKQSQRYQTSSPRLGSSLRQLQSSSRTPIVMPVGVAVHLGLHRLLLHVSDPRAPSHTAPGLGFGAIILLLVAGPGLGYAARLGDGGFALALGGFRCRLSPAPGLLGCALRLVVLGIGVRFGPGGRRRWGGGAGALGGWR